MMRFLTFISLMFASMSAIASPVTPVEKRAAVENFALKDLTGKTHRISDYKGKVIVISLWATW